MGVLSERLGNCRQQLTSALPARSCVSGTATTARASPDSDRRIRSRTTTTPRQRDPFSPSLRTPAWILLRPRARRFGYFRLVGYGEASPGEVLETQRTVRQPFRGFRAGAAGASWKSDRVNPSRVTPSQAVWIRVGDTRSTRVGDARGRAVAEYGVLSVTIRLRSEIEVPAATRPA